jgi:phenylpyruvate tautomerase PptA (4-oxalocrotonate tautomerase family)
MIIGYAVQGTNDRLFLLGLKERWCPEAEMVRGSYRGQTGMRLRAEIEIICEQLRAQDAEVLIFLTDADDKDWRKVKREESEKIPSEYRDITVYGVADPNIEHWYAADRAYLAGRLKITDEDLNVPDLTKVVKQCLKSREGSDIVAIVKEAPLWNWIQNSKSFESFYDEVRDLSQRLGCDIPNEKEKA